MSENPADSDTKQNIPSLNQHILLWKAAKYNLILKKMRQPLFTRFYAYVFQSDGGILRIQRIFNNKVTRFFAKIRDFNQKDRSKIPPPGIKPGLKKLNNSITAN